MKEFHHAKNFGMTSLEKHLIFNHAVLPELVGKHYSKAVDRIETDKSSTDSDKHTDNEVWCLNKGKEDGKIITCDNSV